jgi:hypothetical protein
VTKRETIDAFIRGDIDRRTFIGRLTTLGVSSGAALAYATTFGQSALAAPASNQTGLAAQGQDDLDYGVPNPFPLDEGIAIISEAFETIIGILEGLGDFTDDDFAEGIFDALTTIQEQVAAQFEALGSLLGAGSAGVRQFGQRSQFAAIQAGDPDTFLQDLSVAFDDLTARFAAVVPGTDEEAERQTMMNVAMVSGRHAGFVNWAAGNNPFPVAFQEPMTAGN